MYTRTRRYVAGLTAGLTQDTLLLAFASFFSDVATEMLYPVLPIFLTQVLLAPASVVGIIEGVATATQNIVQGLSGWFSDRLQRRKRVALVGYALAAIAKLFMGFAVIWPQVLAARFADRLGTGVRSAPRDALIASSTDEQHRGAAFGLEGIGDNLGAFVGPIIAVGLLFALYVEIRMIFLLAVIPAHLGVLMIACVSEKPPATPTKQATKRAPAPAPTVSTVSTARAAHLGGLPAAYWKYLLVTALFGIGASSSAFLILRARQVGISLELTILLYAGFNLTAALISYPAGFLSDTLGRRGGLLLSFLLFALTYGGLALTTNTVAVGSLFVLHGLHSGMYRAVGKATATDFAPQAQRASAVGWPRPSGSPASWRVRSQDSSGHVSLHPPSLPMVSSAPSLAPPPYLSSPRYQQSAKAQIASFSSI